MDDRLKIFIVESTPNIALMLTEIESEYELCVFDSGQAAKAAYEACMGHYVILTLIDLNISDMSGVQLLKEMKEVCFSPEMVVVTDRSDLDSAVESMKEGAYDYWIKPLDPKALIENIQHIVLNYDPTRNIEKYNQKTDMVKRHKRFQELMLRKRIDGDFGNVEAFHEAVANAGGGAVKSEFLESFKQAIDDGMNDAAPSPQDKPTVLIVEDEFEARIILNEYLCDHYNVLEAEDGMVALEVVQAHPEIDVILLDIHIPKIKGDKLLPQMLDINPNMEAVVLTAFRETDIAISTLKDGAIEYLNKPYTEEDLLAILKKALGAKSYKTDHSLGSQGVILPLETRTAMFRELVDKSLQQSGEISRDDIMMFFPECELLQVPQHLVIDPAEIASDVDGYVRQLLSSQPVLESGVT